LEQVGIAEKQIQTMPLKHALLQYLKRFGIAEKTGAF